MNGRAAIHERCQGHVPFELQTELDGRVDRAIQPPVGEHVGSDLGDRALEQHDVGLVEGAWSLLAQELHRVVQRLQRLIEPGQGGLEFEWFCELRSQ